MIPELDKAIHQPVRTKIIAYLINMGVTDYTTLKNALDLSDGHMSTHMKELIECRYVAMEKEFVKNKPRTTYRITKEGKKRFVEYVDILKELIALK